MVSKLITHIDQLWIDEASREAAVVERLVSLFPASKIQWIQGPVPKFQNSEMSASEYNQSKRTLYVTPFQGQFFKRCPGASQRKALTCCNYHVLNLGLQCNMNCSYCYLQSYLNSSVMTIYSNLEKALAELSQFAQTQSDFPLRVGTGEVIDSLSLDPLTHYSRSLIDFFKNYPKWTLELKTKSNHIDQFLDCEHHGNIVIGWSINPQSVISNEEHGTASLEERLTAAERCIQKGFSVAFHIDPMIYHPEWQKNYRLLVEELTRRFKKKDIQGITIGTLRFQPEQRHLMRERFGMKSWVTQSEVFLSESGKLRYDSQLRTTMFRFVVDAFKAKGDWPVSLCMETPESWIATYEQLPTQMTEFKTSFRSARLL